MYVCVPTAPHQTGMLKQGGTPSTEVLVKAEMLSPRQKFIEFLL